HPEASAFVSEQPSCFNIGDIESRLPLRVRSSDPRDGTLQRGVRPMTSTSAPNSASSQMLQMLNAFLTVQALHVTAALGIADQLTAGPRNIDDLATAFNRWMTRQSNQHNSALVASYDFSPFRLVADIGGGQGSTLAAILRANPSLRGILLDLAQVVADPAPLMQAGVINRCEVL